MKLSIFLAGIRVPNWLALYNSIPNATSLPKEDYEFVIVSPYDLPPELQNEPNVRLIKDWGNPTRCYQLAVLHSKGEYILFTADDGMFCSNLSVDKGFDILPATKKGVVSFTFTENRSFKKIKPNKMSWHTGGHPFMKALPLIPDNYLLVMAFLMRRDYFIEVGGWDCRFEHPGLALPDLAVRLQNDGAEVILGEKFMDLLNEIGGSHQPVEDAFREHDFPLFSELHSKEVRAKIDFDNWKQTPDVWVRRFPGGKP